MQDRKISIPAPSKVAGTTLSYCFSSENEILSIRKVPGQKPRLLGSLALRIVTCVSNPESTGAFWLLELPCPEYVLCTLQSIKAHCLAQGLHENIIKWLYFNVKITNSYFNFNFAYLYSLFHAEIFFIWGLTDAKKRNRLSLPLLMSYMGKYENWMSQKHTARGHRELTIFDGMTIAWGQDILFLCIVYVSGPASTFPLNHFFVLLDTIFSLPCLFCSAHSRFTQAHGFGASQLLLCCALSLHAWISLHSTDFVHLSFKLSEREPAEVTAPCAYSGPLLAGLLG